MVQNQLIQGCIVTVGNQGLGPLLIEGAGFFHQAEKGASAVVQVRQPMFHFSWAERVNIETDVLAMATITVTLQSSDLVEGDTKVGAAERFVLVKLESVLV